MQRRLNNVLTALLFLTSMPILVGRWLTNNKCLYYEEWAIGLGTLLVGVTAFIVVGYIIYAVYKYVRYGENDLTDIQGPF